MPSPADTLIAILDTVLKRESDQTAPAAEAHESPSLVESIAFTSAVEAGVDQPPVVALDEGNQATVAEDSIVANLVAAISGSSQDYSTPGNPGFPATTGGLVAAISNTSEDFPEDDALALPGSGLLTELEEEIIELIRTLGAKFFELSTGGDTHESDIGRVDSLLDDLENLVIANIMGRENPSDFRVFGGTNEEV